MHLTLEFTRVDQADNPYPQRPAVEEYVVRADGGAIATATLDWRDTELQADLAAMTRPGWEPAAVQRLGNRLRAFLEDAGWRRYEADIVAALEGGDTVHITICANAAEIYRLPWELVTIRASNQHLAELPGVLLRYAWPATHSAKAAFAGDRAGGRIVLAWSAAAGQVPAAEHQQALASACARGHHEFDPARDVLAHVSYRRLRDTLAAAKRDNAPIAVLHILCHGTMHGDSFALAWNRDHADHAAASPLAGPHLAASDMSPGDVPQGDMSQVLHAPVSSRQLRQLLAPHADQVRLVVLCACNSGNPGAFGNHLGSLAQNLHRAGIQTVLSSRFPMSLGGSVALAHTLYRTLLKEPASLERAVLQARQALATNTLDWAGLQLYARPEDGDDTRPVVFRPYRGLLAFDVGHSRFFHGRERERAEIQADLAALAQAGKPQLLVVTGASGTGKSSLVRAGAIPDWLAAMGATAPTWAPPQEQEQQQQRPSVPTAAAAAPGPSAAPNHGAESRLAGGAAFAIMRPGSMPEEALTSTLAARQPGQRFLLVVDQMEEVFTHTLHATTRQRFVDTLWSLCCKDPALVCIVTIRVDFLGRCGEITVSAGGQRFDQVAYDEAHRVFVARMTPTQLQTVIEKPARQVGLALEPGLASRMIAEVAGEPGDLPILQYTLDLLWQRRQGNMLTSAAYDAIGGVVGALEGKAEDVLARLSAPERVQARRLLVRLVGRDDDHAPYTRRRVNLASLEPPRSRPQTGESQPSESLPGESQPGESRPGESRPGESRPNASQTSQSQTHDSWTNESQPDASQTSQSQTHEPQTHEPQIGTSQPGASHPGASQPTSEQRTGRPQTNASPTGAVASDDLASFQAALQALVQARLVVRSNHQGQTALEIAHEDLIRRWPRLLDWLRQDQSKLAEIRKIEAWVASWREFGALLMDDRLGYAVQVLATYPDDLSNEAQAMIAATQEHQRRQKQQALAAQRAQIQAAQRARDAALVQAVARFVGEDATIALALLREVTQPEVHFSWLVQAFAVLNTPVAEVVLPHPHNRHVHSVAFSPNGTRLVTASVDGAVRIWRTDREAAPITLRGHEKRVCTAVFNPAGTCVASASDDGTARVWNADGRGDPIVLRGHTDGVRSVAFSPDGTRVLTASDDRTARVWHVDGSGEPVLLDQHQSSVYCAVFSPDGAYIATASDDATARIWRVDGNGDPVVLSGHEGAVLFVAFSPDSQYVATAAVDGTARVWPVNGQSEPVVLQHIELLESQHPWVRSVGFSPNGQLVTTAALDGTAHIWRQNGHGYPQVLRGHTRELWTAVFSPDGTQVATSSEDGTARIWRLREPSPALSPRLHRNAATIVLRGHRDQIRAVTFSPDGTRVATASFDSSARIWRTTVANPGPALILQGHQERVRMATFSPDGTRVATASDDGTARLWAADGSGEPVVLRGHEAGVYQAAFSPDGRRVLTASWEGKVCIWNLDGGGEPMVLAPMRQGYAIPAAFSPDGTRVLAASSDRQTCLWRVTGPGAPELLHRFPGDQQASFSPDGTKVITWSHIENQAWISPTDGRGDCVAIDASDRGLKSAHFGPDGTQVLIVLRASAIAQLWQADGSDVILALEDDYHGLKALAWAPSGLHLVTTAFGGPVARIWQLDGSGGSGLLHGHTEHIYTAAFNADGTLLVTASADNTARVWRPHGADESVVLGGHEDVVKTAVFSPDGQRVITASDDGTARIWNLHPADVMDRLWAASRHCLAPEARVTLLGEDQDTAVRNAEICRNRVAQR